MGDLEMKLCNQLGFNDTDENISTMTISSSFILNLEINMKQRCTFQYQRN